MAYEVENFHREASRLSCCMNRSMRDAGESRLNVKGDNVELMRVMYGVINGGGNEEGELANRVGEAAYSHLGGGDSGTREGRSMIGENFCEKAIERLRDSDRAEGGGTVFGDGDETGVEEPLRERARTEALKKFSEW